MAHNTKKLRHTDDQMLNYSTLKRRARTDTAFVCVVEYMKLLNGECYQRNGIIDAFL